MIYILLMMVVIVVIAAAVVVYVAYPHRGVDVPKAPWLGRLMRKGTGAFSTIDEEQHDRASR